ncbi:NADP-dependent phosphogluconate dehydrogenase [Halioxenophilus sp. WMMB6]|uniref:NADP-dependent phosphogluconate dehydrogenase n=1 Tax=Halioxenophilus sp. WMMB6 TaxID=3073815 RepID=UPI00295EBCE2|nr:NADP-dependent phosphogluconate dehydrogenase [Halioxenophilus sp. WMMB6]
MASQNNHTRVGLIGLGVMGKNLGLNLTDNQIQVVGFDTDPNKIDLFVEQEQRERQRASARAFASSSLTDLLAQLPSPRTVFLSVPAGQPVDAVCEQLIVAGIGPEDVVIDTGNSLWTDSNTREAHYRSHFLFFSTAVSGGEVGARFGPSLMASGDASAWPRLEPILHAIAAKVEPSTGLAIERQEPGNPVTEGEPCAAYIGPSGSGHFVKMVHNGIEYADMQLICEAYHFMRVALGLTPAQISQVFSEWNQTELNSYLMEISADVLAQADPETGLPLVDIILDKAGQKGTGLWTAVHSLQAGAPATVIAQAVYARSQSAQKQQRVQAAQLLCGPADGALPAFEVESALQQLHDALYCAKICAYAQGFELMQMAASDNSWPLNFAEIAKIWRAGCIIRARFLQSITDAYQRDAELPNLLFDGFFGDTLVARQAHWRQAVIAGIRTGVPMPCMSSALSYFDAFRSETLPANLLQAQRDFFGAHTFQRVDKDPAHSFHLQWSQPQRTLIQTK